MSIERMLWACSLEGLRPHQKLVLIQLSYFENEGTGKCNPSFRRIAAKTGLAMDQVAVAATDLERKGYIVPIECGWAFVESLPRIAIPEGWYPDPSVFEALEAKHPDKTFSRSDAVNDYIRYATAQNVRFLSEDHINRAFFNNISRILDVNGPGRVDFKRDRSRGESASVLNLLSGARSGP